MANRGFSSGLQGMKFMQRARTRLEEAKKEEEKEKEEGDEDHWLTPLAQTSGRCSVISEGDPRPGALIGRMSFKNYNPSIEKLHEELEARRTQAKKKVTTNEDRETPSKVEEDEARPTKRKKLDKAASSSETPQGEQQQRATSTKNQAASGTKNSGTKQMNSFDALQASRGFKKPPAL